MTATMTPPETTPGIGIDWSVDPDVLSRDERVELLVAVDRLRSRAEALELRLVGAVGAFEDHKDDGALSLGVWMARRLDMTRADARRMAADAAKLRRHPISASACFTLGAAKVRELIRRVHPRVESAYVEAEPVLLGHLEDLSVDDTIAFARHWARMVDQDGPEPVEDTQQVSMGRTGDSLHGSFTFHGEDAATLENALNHESDAIYRSEGDEHALSAPQRRAEALMNLIRRGLGADANTTPARPTVIINMDLADLETRAGWPQGTIDPYGPITPATLDRLLCDADVHRVIRGPGSAIIDFGRAERLVKGHQRLAVVARDRHCTFPGCDRPPSMCHAHHIVHWEHDGPTDMHNLTLLCNRHHRLIHNNGYRCRRLPDGTIQYTRPDGTTIDPDP